MASLPASGQARRIPPKRPFQSANAPLVCALGFFGGMASLPASGQTRRIPPKRPFQSANAPLVCALGLFGGMASLPASRKAPVQAIAFAQALVFMLYSSKLRHGEQLELPVLVTEGQQGPVGFQDQDAVIAAGPGAFSGSLPFLRFCCSALPAESKLHRKIN